MATEDVFLRARRCTSGVLRSFSRSSMSSSGRALGESLLRYTPCEPRAGAAETSDKIKFGHYSGKLGSKRLGRNGGAGLSGGRRGPGTPIPFTAEEGAAGTRAHLGVRRSKPPLGSPLPADLPKGLASTIAVFAFRLTRLRTPYVPHTTAGSCSLCLLSECCLWPSSRRGETQEDAGCTSFRRWGRKWGQGREFLYQTHVVKLLREPNEKLVVNANSVEVKLFTALKVIRQMRGSSVEEINTANLPGNEAEAGQQKQISHFLVSLVQTHCTDFKLSGSGR